MKFLLIQTAFIGDVILATAVVEQLHRHYPDASIDFLLRKGNESLLRDHPFIRKTLIWDKKQGKYKQLWHILTKIRSEHYDVVVNCQRFAASGFLTAFSGAKQTVGFRKNPFSFLFSKSLPHTIGSGTSRFGLPYSHEVDRNLSLVNHLTDELPVRPRLYPNQDQTAHAAALAGQQPYVCMAPTSVWFTKQWPAENWSRLIQQIPPDHQVFLLGAPADRDACDAIIENSHRAGVKNLCGTIDLLTSAALLQNAAMNYVNDSAPLHLATAVNAPVTALFCSTLPAFGFTPLSDHSIVLETKESLSCRPCGLHGKQACPLGHFNCGKYAVEVNVHPT